MNVPGCMNTSTKIFRGHLRPSGHYDPSNAQGKEDIRLAYVIEKYDIRGVLVMII